VLAELTARRDADLLQEAAKTKAPAGSDAKKIGDCFESFMDESGIEAKGLEPLKPTLERIAAISDAVDATDAALGEAVGKLYVERYCPAAAKARIEGKVRNEITAFGARIDRLAWMAPATKAKARAKLAALKVGIGWRDYSALEVIRGDALGNAQRASLFEYHRNLQKLGQPVDRSEWVMNPQLVNAVNLPAMNALNFPASR
jgi:predicted metalloendopeptidase